MSSYKLPDNLAEDIEIFAGEVQRFLDGDLPAGILKAKRVPRGVYEQRQDGSYMVRVRVAGGVLAADQAEKLAYLSEQYSNGLIHVTTRQDVQIHDVKIDNTPEIMRQLKEVNLSSKGGGGNTVRNVAACPLAGICRTEIFDVTPFAFAVTEYLIPLVGSYNLPRKYKITFSGCSRDCGLSKINDLGFVASLRNGEAGFKVYVGGGMGASSRTADLLEEWVPTTRAIQIAETVRRLFDKMGDRANRSRARLRFVLERIGIDEFRNLYLEELEKVIADGVPECTIQSKIMGQENLDRLPGIEQCGIIDGTRYYEQHDESLAAVPIHLPMGFISVDDFRLLAKTAGKFSSEKGVRTTKEQNLIIRSVLKDSISDLNADLSSLSFDATSPLPLERFSACAGASTCRLGLCLARGAASACADALQAAKIDADTLSRVKINISGCPNSCGHHVSGDIGVFGTALRNDDRLLPGYRILMGGCCDSKTSRLAKSDGAVPAKALPAVVVALVSDFQSESQTDESFSQYFERQGMPYFVQIIANYTALPLYSEQPDYFRDWTADEDFSLAGRGAGECGAGVFEVISADIASAGKTLEGDIDGNSLFEALLTASRSLLITRGIDTQIPDEVLRLFEEHFIDSGLVPDNFRGLLARGRGYIEGWQEAVSDREDEVRSLLARVELLYGTLDASLVFHPPEDESNPETSNDTPANSAETVEEYDLKGVACPMNFVKAKMKLESLAIGDTLNIILDDGAPVQNVPVSFKNEGQEITEIVDLKNGQWKVSVKKTC